MSLDALELFALLAQVDWKLWTQLLTEIWPELPSRAQITPTDLAPVIVGINMVMRDYQDLKVVEPTSMRYSSHNFCNERDLLVSMLPTADTAIVEVPLRVSLQYEWKRLSKIAEYLDMAERVDQGITSSYRGLRIQSIKFELWDFVLGRPPVRLLMDAIRCGLHVVDFGLMKWDVFHDDPKLYVKAMHTLFAIDHTHDAASSPVRGVEEFKHLQDMRSTMVPSVYSAIAASPSVRSVAVDFGQAAMPTRIRPLALSWMAYALFRRDDTSTQRVQKLTFNVGPLTQDDIGTMDTILQARDPLAELLGRPASLRGATISAKRFSLFDPIAAGRVLVRGDYESAHVLKNLPVVQRTKEWTIVLLPGWGRAWVHRPNVLDKKKSSKLPVTPVISVISEMTLVKMTAVSADLVLQLLEQVGSGLQRLAIEDCDELIDAAWFSHLFNVCTQLESLELKGVEIRGLQVFLDGYVSGTCRLKRLALINTEVHYFRSELEGLIIALSDCQHPLARCLEEFTCHYRGLSFVLDSEMVGSFASMLEQNRRLSILELKTMQRDPAFLDQLRGVMQPLLAFGNQPLGHRKNPRDTKQQLAFLSVLSPRSERREAHSCAMEMLDASVLSIIFEFAAREKQRYVALDIDSE